ncbi:imidazole glycerol phosphate synthase subunit HisH [Synechococcus sp. AH-551-N23]|nr:imidazole glycerol phosphate synthase subunit HisH [Synechococcus sp. AH-551-N23]
MSIAIIDYGVGNVKSLHNAFSKINVNTVVTRDESIIKNSAALVLPGVGGYPFAMSRLEDCGLSQLINDHSKNNKPILGICLGMQLLFSSSEEFRYTKGLDIIKGNVKSFKDFPSFSSTVPNIGWSKITALNHALSPRLFKGIEDQYFYFVHSYCCSPSNPQSSVLSTTNYEETTFCSAASDKMTVGVQFHPEKSGEAGLSLIENFCDLI